MSTTTRFAGYPSAVVYENPDGTKPIQQVIWGDWLRLKDGRQGNYVEVHTRGEDGWIHKDSVQKNRILEIVFVDIGQGDGCLLVTPDDKHMVIDAGVGDNMYRFLRWRYGGFDQPWRFEAGVITHPDSDHYKGFTELFKEKNITFGVIYHNGIMERKGRDRLGKKTRSGRPRYLTELVRSRADLDQFLSVPSRWKGKKPLEYPGMLKMGLDSRRFTRFQMLSIEDGHMPGYEPEKDLSIQVLGPLLEPDNQGNPRLRWLSDVGKTKNGHSVVLRIQYHRVSILLGGDLNIPSQNLLLSHHTGLTAPPESMEQYTALIEAARRVFQVDVAKACHHGSADFSTDFLAATNPVATVISSGDNEPHSHPRADTLGATGLYSRGARPLIFSTELARSPSESVKHPYVLQAQLKELNREIDRAPIDTARDRRRKDRLRKQFNKLVGSIDRSIAVYGAINLRTDGHKVVIAQKIEQPRSKARKWDIYCMESHGNGPLQYISKY